MKIRLNNFSKKYFYAKQEMDSAISSLITNETYILKENVKNFEKNLCIYLGSKFCVVVASGNDVSIVSIINDFYDR